MIRCNGSCSTKTGILAARTQVGEPRVLYHSRSIVALHPRVLRGGKPYCSGGANHAFR